MNPIDRVINFFAPRAGLKRVQARAQTATIMNYDAASRGRRTYGWKAPGTAADAAAYGQRDRLRNLSRDMIRNRPYAARAQAVMTANVVGTGIIPSVQCEDKKTLDIVNAIVKQHLLTVALDAYGEADLYEMQSVVMSTVFSDGEVLARRRMRDPRYNPDLKLPFQVELLETDHLNLTVQNNGANEVIEGVEYGPTGAIEAYHLYQEHPGRVRQRNSLKSVRVPWQDILHIRRFDRPGQLRGVPWLAPAMMTLGELSDYQEAQIAKQRMAALMAVIIEYEDGNQPKEKGNGLEDLAPGAVVHLPTGAKPNFTTPPTVEGYDDFMRRGLTAVAVATGLTYESLSGDLKGVNFSSGRMGRMDFDRLVKMYQSNLIVGQFCLGIERWVREALSLSAPTVRLAPFTVEWTAPRRILVDPTKEIPAMVTEIEARVSSRQRVQRELGYDPETIRRENALDAAADREDLKAGGPTPLKAIPKKKGTVDENGQ